MTHNCNFVRQLQRDLPPYPTDIGVYPFSPPPPRPSTLQLPNIDLSIPSPTHAVIGDRQKHPSILKHYKSCPVSPVHEEHDWTEAELPPPSSATTTTTTRLRPSTHQQTAAIPLKRHSMYSEDAKTILDMIHMDTEKMIAEITQKYGDDIDTYDPIKKAKLLPKSSSAVELNSKFNPTQIEAAAKPLHHDKEHGFLSADEDGNFSSDSLEDCSLDLDLHCRTSRKTCHKHNKKPAFSTLPTRSVSDYFIYDQFQSDIHRNVSLSDILNDEDGGGGGESAAAAQKEHFFLTSQRHSSASFFLGPNADKKSQESLLSDDISGGGGGGGVGSYFNSMESILSDDSECKSAPLEVLFLRVNPQRQRNSNLIDFTCAASKSYGSSPNSAGFDYFMQHGNSSSYNTSHYDYLLDATSAVDASVVQASSHSSATLHNQTYPWISQTNTKIDEFIPRLHSPKTVVVSKSLSKEFADHRYTNNTNPMMSTKPALPAKPQLKRVDIFSGTPNESSYIMKKSTSFDVDMFDGAGRRLQRSTKKYVQNLEKFENERKRQFGVPMDYVPHKPPPVANRRSASMKNKRYSRDKDRYHTVGQIHCSSGDRDEKSFEIYIAEKSVADNEQDNQDSLEFYAKPTELTDSVDSLLDVAAEQVGDKSVVSADFLTAAEYLKFRDIEKKIDVINKLVELEERKLEQERVQKEMRLRPFRCDSKQKGYVKSLTMNFDKLATKCAATTSADDWNDGGPFECGRIKRNFSLPDVLEGAKFQAFEMLAADSTMAASVGAGEDLGLDINLCNSTLMNWI